MPATIPVTTLADDGPGSLRFAVERANLDPSPDTITFDPAVRGTITLLSALPDLTTDLTIDGPGPDLLTVARDAGGAEFRVFNVATVAAVRISGLTVSGGVSPAGGGIANGGVLVLDDVTVSGNTATVSQLSYQSTDLAAARGGGVDNTGTLTLVDSRVTGNVAVGGLVGGLNLAGGNLYARGPGNGGGIANSGTLALVRTAVLLNETGGPAVISGQIQAFGGGGGGVFNAGTATAAYVTIGGNTAGAGDGGGVDNEGRMALAFSTVVGNLSTNSAIPDRLLINYSNFGGQGGGVANRGTLTVDSSTISGNSARGIFFSSFETGESYYTGGGGGIFNAGPLAVLNTTVQGNAALQAPSSRTLGGGIYATYSLSLLDDTVSDNSADRGGGLFVTLTSNPSATAEAAAVDTLFQNRVGGNVQVGRNGTFRSLGHTLFSDAPGVPLDPTDLTDADPRLGPLADNGGPTYTRALLPGSPAIDAGVAIPGVTADQRGSPRPSGAAPDIGAFEAGGVVPVTPPPTVTGLRRSGLHRQPTALRLSFSAALDPTAAGEVRNYSLVPAGPAGRAAPRARPVPIASAAYDPSALAVTLTPSRRLALHGYYRLTVNGTPPAGVRGANGVPLDGAGTGQPGTDYVALVHGPGAVAPQGHVTAHARSAAVPGGPRGAVTAARPPGPR